MKDFFISYNSADRAWAEWIGWMLEEAGYSVVIQAWDFRPGGNFVLGMHQAATGTRKTVVILSKAFLEAEYTQPEWAAAFVEDPRGERRKLIPLRVAPCSPRGLLKAVIYADLVGLSAEEAKAALLTAVSDDDRVKPAREPAFPGLGAPAAAAMASDRGPGAAIAGTVSPSAAYPGKAAQGSGALALWREKLEFLSEREATASDAAQLFSLRKQIDEARRKISELER